MKRNHEKFTYLQFVKYIQHSEVKHSGSSDKRGKERQRFTSTESLAEAIDLAINGWDAGIKEMELEKDLTINGSAEVHHNVVGSFVDVGAYLSGSPECMMEFVDYTERDKPELTIYVMLTYPSFWSTEDALQYAKNCLNIINKANVNYAVKVVGVFLGNINKTEDIVEITIKNHYDSFALNSLAFAFHPSFFRRMWFKHLETKDYWTSSYGNIKGNEFEIINTIKSISEDDKFEKWYLPSLHHKGVEIKAEEITKWK